MDNDTDFFVKYNEGTDSVRTTITHDMANEEDILKDDLRYYFMNPCDKYRARRQIPWKLGVQILKIIMITTQLVLFGLNNQLVVSYKEENALAFKNLFLKGYSGVDENDYCVAVYSQEDFYDHLFYVFDQYRQLKNLTVGPVGYAEDDSKLVPLVICKEHYKRGTVEPSDEFYDIDAQIERVCLSLDPTSLDSWKTNNESFFVLDFYRLIGVTISFQLKGINLQTVRSLELPDCYTFFLTRFSTFFHVHYKRKVCKADQKEFFNGWYILVIISDIMAIVGSILKMEIQSKSLTSYDVCSIFLGTSTLMVWVGVIRYLGYFQKYNVLILTMKAAFPKVLRFCCCAGMIYLGYTFCGWIVLGPYHEKFEGLSRVAECLFSLVNGDDMFATFAQFQEMSVLVWVFSRVYLYSFISLFIYMVLSLFIALITDAYETIKNYQKTGFPVTDLQKFLKDHKDFPCSEDSRELERDCLFLCCCRRCPQPTFARSVKHVTNAEEMVKAMSTNTTTTLSEISLLHVQLFHDT
ncbi:mucolipin-2 isoform X4 [Anguilla anguilla]|uniref:mucolipin-2 isoform X4 n=1 Tax=Anguilla anguilla TaxID=7936 RepID=UPI0015A9577C|nr:mucolipin-2 isoform X4 [Anguilla anguilla]